MDSMGKKTAGVRLQVMHNRPFIDVPWDAEMEVCGAFVILRKIREHNSDSSLSSRGISRKYTKHPPQAKNTHDVYS